MADLACWLLCRAVAQQLGLHFAASSPYDPAAHPATPPLAHPASRSPNRPPTHLTLLPQIIALVREQGTDSLQLPPPDQLAAGPFAAPGNYEAYHQLMRDCRWVLPLEHFRGAV